MTLIVGRSRRACAGHLRAASLPAAQDDVGEQQVDRAIRSEDGQRLLAVGGLQHPGNPHAVENALLPRPWRTLALVLDHQDRPGSPPPPSAGPARGLPLAAGRAGGPRRRHTVAIGKIDPDRGAAADFRCRSSGCRPTA